MNSSKAYKPTLAMFVSRFPFPLEKGDKLRAYYQLKDLSKDFNVHLFCTTDVVVSEESFVEVRKFCQKIHVFPLRKGIIPLQLIRAFFLNIPFQVGYFYQFWINKAIQRELKKLNPDYIFCQLIRSSEYVKNYHLCPKTIDYMDALSKGMERRYESEKGILKSVYKLEFQRLTQYERHIFDFFEHHVIISEQDSKYILHPEKHKIQWIQNGVDERFFSIEKTPIQHRILFTGNMSYAPNVDAAKFLVNQVLPIINQSMKNVSICISGANPNAEIRKLASNSVQITGWVDDIADSYKKAQVFVAPMLLGSGLQNKLLEAMACGVPCITTPLANNALQAKENEEILLANTAEEFANRILFLFNNASIAEDLALKGQNFIRNQYHWNSLNKQLISLIKN
jgi:sugar transferase (PEP-CTERM/EpsH1 system associated)